MEGVSGNVLEASIFRPAVFIFNNILDERLENMNEKLKVIIRSAVY